MDSLASDTPPPALNSSENAPEADPAEKQFVGQLATFFNAVSLLRVDWESATRVRCHGFTAGGDCLATPSVDEPATRLPFKDGEFDTVFNFASLNCLNEAALDVWLAELRRVTGRNLWLALEPAPGRERVWWEKRLMEAGFRKHPLSLAVVPFEQIEREESQLTLLFEKIPAPALERYPLAALKAERDLHMDMLREPGIRSDAHLARYELARQYLKPGMVVLDAACGLGYGSAHLAAGTGVARVIGVDCSDYAVAYATANYAAEGGKVEFHAADATQLTWLADGSVDLVVSFETLEHLQNPEVLLREFFRVLRPGGTIIASVPNRWVDEQGNNPIPWHFQIYDFGRFRDELARHFQAAQFYRQNAGGGFHRPQPRMLQALTGAPTESDDKDAEWWIAAARKPLEQSLPALVAPAQTPPRIVVLDEEQRYEELYGRVFERLGVRPMSGFNRSVEEVLAMKPDAILLSREWTYTWRLIAAAARRANVPVIYVMDGVIEWSYVWNNLTFVKPEGTVLQPLLASHLSVIGRHPARILAGLGLADRTHLVGLPRLDRSARAPRKARGQKPKLLISTAKAPGHNTEHKVLVRRALRDLKQWFDQNPFVTPVWRIADQYAGDIGVRAERAGTFQEALAEVSGVLSFTSTCLLEAMLQGVPTAQVDYRAVPLYVQTAWEVRCAEHIPGVIQELLYPPPEKLAFQEQCFEDEVEPGDASERLAQVILGAIAEARNPGAKAAGSAAAGCGPLDFHQVHSQLSAFSGSLQASLQYELDALQNLYDRARYELDLTRQHAGRLETQAREREQAMREMECRGREREQAIRDLTALRQEQELIIQELRQLCAQQQRTIGQLDQPRGERAAAAPGDHGANGHLTAEDYLREAEAAGQQGEADTARQLLQTAIQRWPARAQFQDALGNLEWQCGDFAAAYEAYARAAALPPQSAAAFLKAALAAKAMGKPAACEAALMAVFQFEPANREASNALAFLRLEQGRYGEAARMLEKILDESPDDLNALLGLVKCQYKQGDLVGARLDCLRALKLDPENAVARESLTVLNAPPAGAGPAPDTRDLREKFRDAAEQVLEWNPRGQPAAANGANSQTTHVEGRTYGM